MPSSTLVTIYAGLSMILLFFTGGGEALLGERTFALSEGLSTDTETFWGRLNGALRSPLAVALISWMGWGLSFLLLRLGRWGQLYTPLGVHPAAVLLTAGGYGVAMAALLAVFISIERVMVSRSTSSVPSLGIALGGAALAVPGFRDLFVAFAAPLVLVAPRAMLERHMLVFYLVSLLPAVAIMTIMLVFDPSDQSAPRLAHSTSLPTSAAAIPALGLAAALFTEWRLTTALAVITAGAFIGTVHGTGWPVALGCLAAGFALHRRRQPFLEVTFAIAVVLAAILLARHINGV